jgi:predicted nucleic acid-binding protein
VKTAVDTNVLLDVLAGDEEARAAATDDLTEAARAGALTISPITYAELAVAFAEPTDLARSLEDLHLEVEVFSTQSLLLAANAWRAYARHCGQGAQCPRCGNQFGPRCPECGANVRQRQHIISDFLIGGHAQAQADVLLTRDRGYFSRYFPGISVQALGGE